LHRDIQNTTRYSAGHCRVKSGGGICNEHGSDPFRLCRPKVNVPRPTRSGASHGCTSCRGRHGRPHPFPREAALYWRLSCPLRIGREALRYSRAQEIAQMLTWRCPSGTLEQYPTCCNAQGHSTFRRARKFSPNSPFAPDQRKSPALWVEHGAPALDSKMEATICRGFIQA
jgi:hypothetical protein